MTEREMFERSFQRPTDFFKRPLGEQFEIDEALGILDWRGEDLSNEDRMRYFAHYKQKSSRDGK